MRRIILLICDYDIFPHYLINRTVFGKGVFENKMFSFSEQFLSETFLMPRKINEVLSSMHIGLHVKYSLFVSDSNET